MSSPNMNMRPYIGDESGSQLVPEPSRLIGSARSMVECIDIRIFTSSCSPAAPYPCEGTLSCPWLGRLGSIAPTFDVERWKLGVRRFFSFIGTSFIPHFGQLPG